MGTGNFDECSRNCHTGNNRQNSGYTHEQCLAEARERQPNVVAFAYNGNKELCKLYLEGNSWNGPESGWVVERQIATQRIGCTNPARSGFDCYLMSRPGGPPSTPSTSPTDAPSASPTSSPTESPTSIPTTTPTETSIKSPTEASLCHWHKGHDCPGCDNEKCCDDHYVPLSGSNFNCKWTNSACVQSTTACSRMLGYSCPGCKDQSCCDSYYVTRNGSNFNCMWTNSACAESTTPQ